VYLQIINIAFPPHILLLFLPIAILPECNKGQAPSATRHEIKRSEELKRKDIEEKEEKEEKK
jgi:hypothetical protein